MNSERECYGKMFPPITDVTHNKPISGKVFGYEADYGGQVAQRRFVTVNHDTWEQCLKCPDLDGCYRVSAGKMLMELAIRTEPESQYR